MARSAPRSSASTRSRSPSWSLAVVASLLLAVAVWPHAGLATIAAILIGLRLAVTALAAAPFPRRGKAIGLAATEPLA